MDNDQLSFAWLCFGSLVSLLCCSMFRRSLHTVSDAAPANTDFSIHPGSRYGISVSTPKPIRNFSIDSEGRYGISVSTKPAYLLACKQCPVCSLKPKTPLRNFSIDPGSRYGNSVSSPEANTEVQCAEMPTASILTGHPGHWCWQDGPRHVNATYNAVTVQLHSRNLLGTSDI